MVSDLRLKHLLVMAGVLTVTGTALADEALQQAMKSPKNWAMQAGNDANHRYSTLKPDQQGQRQEPAGRMDLLHRRAARP